MIEEMAKKAKAASFELARLPTETKNRALLAMADALEKEADRIIAANRKDVDASRAKGVRQALLDRLILDKKRVGRMAQGLREVAELPDPIGEVIKTWSRPNGLIVSQVRVPLGVVGMIYESRPDVTSDASGICLKSGNAVIMKGGSDAVSSNIAIGEVLRNASDEAGAPRDAIQVVGTADRSASLELMKLREYVDVLIPRGGVDLIKTVVENARVPVIETGLGNCHIYVEEDADLENAVEIILNAKCQRPGTCNAAEKLLVHEDIAAKFLPRIIEKLKERKVEVRGDEKTMKMASWVVPATEDDWPREYLDLIIGVKVVGGLDEAIAHINRYGTRNSESILTTSFQKAMRFIREVDAAAVYWNASTRFTDGNQFGFGAEIGISTQKTHVRGPIGVQHLTTTKYFVLGQGQIRE